VNKGNWKKLGAVVCAWPLLQSVQAETISCADAYTPIETTICQTPALSALDRHLDTIMDRAIQRRVLADSDVATMRNQIARRCSRQANDALSACLLSAEGLAFQSVMSRLTAGAPQTKARIEARTRFNGSSEELTEILTAQVKLGEGWLKLSGEPEFLVTTLVELMQMAERNSNTDQNLFKAQAVLKRRLATGCDSPVYGTRWQAVLAGHKQSDLSCNSLNANVKYSQSEL